MHLAVLPDSRSARLAEGSCLSDDDLSLNNSEFLAHVRAAAALLRERGVGDGEVVAVMLPNQVEFVIALFAAWRIGATVTPINPSLTSSEVEYQLADSGAKVLISDVADMRVDTIGVGDLRAAVEPGDEPPVPQKDDALALLIYTSGTTGKPKGVMLDHANLQAMCSMAVDSVGLSATDHSLLILPLFHVNGIVVSVLSPLLAGGRTTIAGKFSATQFLGLVERVRPTYFSGVPAIYAMLVAQPAEPRPDLSSLRRVICGAAPMPAELIARFEDRFGVPIVEGYGLSEGTCASTLNPVAGPRKPGTVGLPLPGQTITIVDIDGDPVPDGTPGEVVISGPNIMRGYLGKPEETAKTVRAGRLHTGDVGYLDADGYLVLVDRIKDMIIRGGENLYPKEIENALYRHPAVHEAAVVGRPDPVLGEVPVAHVVAAPESPVSAEELTAHCRDLLAAFKIPAAIVLTTELPRNPVGKIDKKRLRALAE